MESDDGDPTNSGQPIPQRSQLAERLSPDAVRALYDVHGRDLLTFLTGVLRNPDAAQDVCQNVFRTLLEVGHESRPETVRGWLFKVAFHEAVAYRRKQSRGRKSLNDNDAAVEPKMELDVSLQLVKKEEVARLRQLLQELPAEQQFVVRQRIQEEKTFVAIAEELKVPLGTVLTRMRLAVQKLQKWFGPQD